MVITAGSNKVGNGIPVKIVEKGTIKKTKEEKEQEATAEFIKKEPSAFVPSVNSGAEPTFKVNNNPKAAVKSFVRSSKS
jgi:hypothetical protein